MPFQAGCSVLIFPCLWLQVLDYVFLEDCVFVCRAVPVFVASWLLVRQYPYCAWPLPDAISRWLVPVLSTFHFRKENQLRLQWQWQHQWLRFWVCPCVFPILPVWVPVRQDLPVVPCVAWFHLCVAVQLSAFQWWSHFVPNVPCRSRLWIAHVAWRVCQMPKSAFPSYHCHWVFGSCLCRGSSSRIRHEHDNLVWTICYRLGSSPCLLLPADRSANALRLYAGKSVAEWCPSVFGTLHRICVHQPVWCPVW